MNGNAKGLSLHLNRIKCPLTPEFQNHFVIYRHNHARHTSNLKFTSTTTRTTMGRSRNIVYAISLILTLAHACEVCKFD